MRLHCLGTVGYHPNGVRHTSCYFLPESGIVLDAGTGIFRLAPLIETESLDILLSHAHLDHTAGLTFLLDVLYQRPVEQLRIWGEAEKLAAVRKHLFDPLIFPVQLDAEWIEIDGLDEFSVGDAKVRWRAQDHPGGSVGYRLDWDDPAKRLVYLTDTTGDTSAKCAQWAGRADLMMHECYFRDSAAEWAQKSGHSYTSRVADIAEQAGPGRLLLTHINPLEKAEDPVDIQIIRERIGDRVSLAQDEMVVEF